ncbi:MAG: saccharopine dehydrogenase NADP-binding domain-containing protein [Xanthomonadales bacterium]|nr:saccharopine dehydrogenase NADP-binding domain-containing protein [Xanthomonadales bacterium]
MVQSKQKKAIIVTGGYGALGSRIVRNLVQQVQARVVVAGRDYSQAREMADEVGSRVSHRRIDVDNPDSIADGLDNAGLIINCAPQTGEPQLAAAAARGAIPYLDVTSDYRCISQMLALDDEAREGRTRMLLGCGLVPGLANLMARSAVEGVTEANSITTHLWWQTGPEFSPSWMEQLTDLGRKFPVMKGEYDRSVSNFSESRRVSYPAPARDQREYHFCLPDQFFYPDTLGVAEASSWLSLGSGKLTRLLNGLSRSKVTGLMGRKAIEGLTRRAVDQIPEGRKDRWIVMVDVAAESGVRRVIAEGTDLAESAAMVATEMARRLLRACPAPGVWMPEEVMTLDALFRPLMQRGIKVHAMDLESPQAA